MLELAQHWRGARQYGVELVMSDRRRQRSPGQPGMAASEHDLQGDDDQ